MKTAVVLAEGRGLKSQQMVSWMNMRRITITGSLLFLILGGVSTAWAKGEVQANKANPYLHRADVSIHLGGGGLYLGGGGIYFGVPYGPVYVQPHRYFGPQPRFYGRHGQHKRHFKPSRKYYRFKERGDRHRGHSKKGRHRGRHHQKFRH